MCALVTPVAHLEWCHAPLIVTLPRCLVKDRRGGGNTWREPVDAEQAAARGILLTRTDHPTPANGCATADATTCGVGAVESGPPLAPRCQRPARRTAAPLAPRHESPPAPPGSAPAAAPHTARCRSRTRPVTRRATRPATPLAPAPFPGRGRPLRAARVRSRRSSASRNWPGSGPGGRGRARGRGRRSGAAAGSRHASTRESRCRRRDGAAEPPRRGRRDRPATSSPP